GTTKRRRQERSQSHLTAQVHSSLQVAIAAAKDGEAYESQSHLTAQVHSSEIYEEEELYPFHKEVAIPPHCSGPFLLSSPRGVTFIIDGQGVAIPPDCSGPFLP